MQETGAIDSIYLLRLPWDNRHKLIISIYLLTSKWDATGSSSKHTYGITEVILRLNPLLFIVIGTRPQFPFSFQYNLIRPIPQIWTALQSNFIGSFKNVNLSKDNLRSIKHDNLSFGGNFPNTY
jgi:hypothetical protein